MGVRIFDRFYRLAVSMSELYDRLSRIFLEVSTLHTGPRMQRKTKKSSYTPDSLFDEPAQVGYIQILPGLFDQRVGIGTLDSHCFFVLDAPAPILLPGSTADFAEAEFRFPLYQIPFYSGQTAFPNINHGPIAEAYYGQLHSQSMQLDQDLAKLIDLIASSSLPPPLSRSLIDQLRLWNIEDYHKPVSLNQVVRALVELNSQLSVYPPPAMQYKALKELITSAKSIIIELTSQAMSKPDPWVTFVNGLEEAMPHLAVRPINNILKSYINKPNGQRLSLAKQNLPNNEWQKQLSATSRGLENLYINESYSIFAQQQLW